MLPFFRKTPSTDMSEEKDDVSRSGGELTSKGRTHLLHRRDHVVDKARNAQ